MSSSELTTTHYYSLLLITTITTTTTTMASVQKNSAVKTFRMPEGNETWKLHFHYPPVLRKTGGNGSAISSFHYPRLFKYVLEGFGTAIPRLDYLPVLCKTGG